MLRRNVIQRCTRSPYTFDPRVPQARLDSAPVYKLNVTLRGLSTLAVTV